MRAHDVFWGSVLVLASCTGTVPNVPGPTVPTIGRAPSVDRAREPLRSFAPPDTTIFGRFELARMRSSPNASLYSDAVRRFYTFRTLLAETGWDPVQHLDQALVAAPHLWNPDAIVVLRTRESSREVRERLRATWERRGSSLSCSDASGYEICAWPSRTDRMQAVLFSAEHEVVIAEPQHMAELVRIAANQAAHRTRPDEIVEPMLASPQEPIARIRETNPPWFFEPSPSVADLVAYELSSGRLAVALDARWDSEAVAIDAERRVGEFVRVYLREPMLSGVASLLAALRVDREADHVIVRGEYGDADIVAALTVATLMGR